MALLAGSPLSGQGVADAYVRSGDARFQQMAYALAVEDYATAAELGAVNEHVTKRLAECHMRLGNTEEAERWYAIVVKFLNREPKDMYHYAEALKSNGKYNEAEEWMDRYLATLPPEGGPRRSNISSFANKFNEQQDRFTVSSVSVNTPFSDFGTAWCGPDKVIFASARNETVGIQRRAAWNDQPFLDLFIAERSRTGDLLNAREVEGGVNSKLHEGPATCSVDGSTLYFTRNNFFKGKVSKSKTGINRLGIYKARGVAGEWDDVDRFLYNNSECSVGHPALSQDGRWLFFVSDMPGGIGGSDIYVCRDLGGQWSEPENLGPAINTPYDELTPFVGADGTLYFSSNGHPGLGGLDVFAAPRNEDGGFSVAVNVGSPVNSPKDEISFILDKEGRTGYFSSDRPGGKGGDDIYSFVMHYPLEQRFLCTGVVIDDEDEEPVIQVDVTLYDDAGNVVATTTTDAKGQYSFGVKKNREYKVVARMKGRFDGEQHLSTEGIEREQIIARDIHLVPDAGVWLRGTVRLKDQLGFIQDMIISVVNLSSFYSEQTRTGPGGDFSFRLQPNEEFEVLMEKPGFYSMSVPVSTIGVRQGIIDLNQARELAFERVQVGVPNSLRFVSWSPGAGKDLDPIARTELDGLVERLKVNPALKVEVAVHSDARGDAEKDRLSTQKRAEVVADYLKSKGVPKDRLVAKGYGNSRLLNHCVPGVQCSEEEHLVNRRVEWTVLDVVQ
ncbi:MAG: carboxypeptidase regulatory-like domain-containing protein [Flavobacteriales bacterium]|nr:carboxypeptidase regulatory-like domain-containing protein [Flavobacteriales bacterium]